MNGGIPLRDRSIIGKINCIMGDEKFNLLNCLLLDWELYLSIRNSGIITEQYNLKYVIVRDGFIIYRRLVIHPIWVIDE